MNTRIKALRQKLGLTQGDFGKGIGVSQNYIWMIEKGDRTPANRTIADICRIYNVNEVWLRTGVGEPFAPKSRKDALDEYIGQLSEGKRSDIEQLLIELMAETTVEEWAALANVFKKIADKMNKPSAD